jgi:hypothetical protein
MDLPQPTLTTGETSTGAAMSGGTPGTRKHAKATIKPPSAPSYYIQPLLFLVKFDILEDWGDREDYVDYNEQKPAP